MSVSGLIPRLRLHSEFILFEISKNHLKFFKKKGKKKHVHDSFCTNHKKYCTAVRFLLAIAGVGAMNLPFRLLSSVRANSLRQSSVLTSFALKRYSHSSTHGHGTSHLKIRVAAAAIATLTVGGIAVYENHVHADAIVNNQNLRKPNSPEPESTDLVNWSGTHSVTTDRYYQPETIEDLKTIVKDANEKHQKLRPVGSALSPNGLPFNKQGMVSLCNMDKIVGVDTRTKRITVEAGARVSQVLEALRPFGLTLQNFASITEQQIGGFIQVSAHGTGMNIPTVDEQVIGIRIITPAVGELYLSENDKDPSLFHVARTSLGLTGVVAEVTLQCVDAHKLLEKAFVLTRQQLVLQHKRLLTENRHLRYLWIPHTDDVVVITCNPVQEGEIEEPSKIPMEDRLNPLTTLLKSHPNNKLSDDKIQQLSFTSLRDHLLALDPLNSSWVQKVNKSEANFWRQSKGIRIDWSDQILQFDCGGQQWVSEIAFPVQSREEEGNNDDINYMLDLLKIIDNENIPAHSPIEQRWTAPSRSPMSPASEKPDKQLPDFYSWVGIIMYLPDEHDDPVQRKKITEAFKSYKGICERRLWPKVGAVEHWAKIEMPQNEKDKILLQQRTAQKYPTEAFKAICGIFDPHGILRNELTDTILGPELSP